MVMRSGTRAIAILGLISSTFAGPPAQATTFVERDFAEVIQENPAVVRGQIGMSYGDWGKAGDGTRRLYTFYELKITEAFKGQFSTPTLTFREIGGTKDGVAMQVSGSAHFERGEDVVVILGDKSPEGAYDLYGMMMGRFGIARDENGAEVLTGAGLGLGHAGQLVHTEGADHDEKQGQGGATGARQRWTIDSLRQLVDAQKNHPSAPGSTPIPSGNHALIPTPVPSDKPRASVSPAAPPLHSDSAEEAEASGAGSLPLKLLFIAGLLSAGIFGRRWLRRKG